MLPGLGLEYLEGVDVGRVALPTGWTNYMVLIQHWQIDTEVR